MLARKFNNSATTNGKMKRGILSIFYLNRIKWLPKHL